MPQDALTIRRCTEELNEELAGAKVNKVAQPTADEVILTFYRNGKTTASSFPQTPLPAGSRPFTESRRIPPWRPISACF